jgi:drug/metabolite transporter (DMT)-like permease
MTALLALSGAIIIGGADFAAGLFSRRAAPARVTVWVQTGSFITAAVAVWFIGWDRVTGADVIAGVVAGLSGGFSFIAFYAALAKGQMGRVTPVTAVVGAILPSVIGVVRGEALGPLMVAGSLVGLVAIWLVTQDRGPGPSHTPPLAFFYAAVAGVGFAIFYLALDATSPDAGIWPLVYARIASVPATILVARVATGGIAVDRPLAKGALAAGVLEMAANVLALFAFQRGPLVVATIMSSFYPLSTVLLARVVLKERLRWLQSVGLILGVAAVPLIALG